MPLSARFSHALLHALRPPLEGSRLDGRLVEYLEKVAAGRIGIPAGESGGKAQTRIGEGRNTAVRAWRTQPAGTLFARGWRYDRRMRPAASHAAAAGLMAEAGLAVPGIALLDDSLATLWKWRLECVVERAAPGRPLSDAATDWNPPLIAAVAADLARLHRGKRSAWGTPWRPENEMSDPKAYWAGRTEKLLARIPGKTLSIPREKAVGDLESLARRFAAIPLPKPSLVHGDLSPAHLFAQAEGEKVHLTWIDFGTVHFGHPAEDWSVVRRWPIPPGTFEKIGAQAAQSDPEGMAGGTDFAEAMDLFERLRLWEKLGTRIVKRAHREETMSAGRAERLRSEQAAVERQIAALSENP